MYCCRCNGYAVADIAVAAIDVVHVSDVAVVAIDVVVHVSDVAVVAFNAVVHDSVVAAIDACTAVDAIYLPLLKLI